MKQRHTLLMAQCGSWCLCPVHSWTGKVPLQPSKLEPVTPWHVFLVFDLYSWWCLHRRNSYFFSENRFFSQTMHPDYSFPFFHSPQLSLIFPLPWIHSVSVSSSEWSRPPRDCNQTGQNKVQQEKAKAFHIEAGQGNPQGGKEPPKQENRVKKYTCFRCSESHKIAKLTAITKDLVQVSAGP